MIIYVMFIILMNMNDVLYKLIFKIKYYNEFVKNLLKDDEYHFLLLFIYNNSPFAIILNVIIDKLK